MAEVAATEELFWRLFTLYLTGALLPGVSHRSYYGILLSDIGLEALGMYPPDAPKPAMIPSAIVRAPSTSRVTITSYSR